MQLSGQRHVLAGKKDAATGEIVPRQTGVGEFGRTARVVEFRQALQPRGTLRFAGSNAIDKRRAEAIHAKVRKAVDAVRLRIPHVRAVHLPVEIGKQARAVADVVVAQQVRGDRLAGVRIDRRASARGENQDEREQAPHHRVPVTEVSTRWRRSISLSIASKWRRNPCSTTRLPNSESMSSGSMSPSPKRAS